MSLFFIDVTQRPQQDDDTFTFCPPYKYCISSYLESISEQLQFGKQLSVGIQTLKSFQTLQPHFTLLNKNHQD